MMLDSLVRDQNDNSTTRPVTLPIYLSDPQSDRLPLLSWILL